MGGKSAAGRAEALHVPTFGRVQRRPRRALPAVQISPAMLFVKPSMWVGLATQTSLLSTTITMLAAPLGALLGAGISQGAGKLVNVAMLFAVTWLLANLQPSVIYFAIVGIAVVAAIVVIAVGPETRAKRLG